MPISMAPAPGRVDAQVATLTGEIDVASSPTVEAALLEAVASGAALVVDVSGVTFFDSSGLHAFDTVRQRAAAAAVPLLLVGASEQLVRVLTITRLLDAFELRPDVASALDGLPAGS